MRKQSGDQQYLFDLDQRLNQIKLLPFPLFEPPYVQLLLLEYIKTQPHQLRQVVTIWHNVLPQWLGFLKLESPRLIILPLDNQAPACFWVKPPATPSAISLINSAPLLPNLVI